jgi:peroxiredoxin family protein
MSIVASGSVASTTSVSPAASSAMRRFAIVSGSGHARPRASTVVTIAIVAASPALAAILSTGEPERLYSGLSALVSTAADGAPVAALASFGSLDLILDPDLRRRVQEPDATPSLAWAGRETFARSLAELIDTALALDNLTVHACAASIETMGLDPAGVTARGLDGVKSTPRFLRDAAEATLIFV